MAATTSTAKQKEKKKGRERVETYHVKRAPVAIDKRLGRRNCVKLEIKRELSLLIDYVIRFRVTRAEPCAPYR